VKLLQYLGRLSADRCILWSYVIWWLAMVFYYFRPDPRLWLTSIGISVIVGYALMLSTGSVNAERFRSRFWESLRLFLAPFLVSSFAALVAGKEFFLVFSPHWIENLVAASSIVAFLFMTRLCRWIVLRGES